MADNHPAKIAKYLLKGWCLLNEYCPNGHNIPLVRSRSGQLVCVCGDASCAHHLPEEGVAGYPATAPATQPAASPPRVVAPAQLMPAYVAAPAQLTSSAPVADSSTRDISIGKALPRDPLFVGSASDASSLVELALAGPEFGFGCVRVDTVSDQRLGPQPARLIGDRYAARVRVAAVAGSRGLDASGLRDALRAECNRLERTVLVPEESADVVHPT